MRIGLLLIFSALLIASCVPTKDYYYFSKRHSKPLKDSIYSGIKTKPLPVHIIESGDELEVSLSPENSLNTNTENVINQPQLSRPTYVVPINGYISFPLIGKVNVIGKTVEILQDSLGKIYKSYFNEPYVSIKIRNFPVTVLGDVRFPGVKQISGDHGTLLQALASAGDMNEEALRYNVKLIRTSMNGTVTTYNIDMASIDVFESDAYFLKSNDVIYVRPIKARRYLNRVNVLSVSVTMINSILILIATFTK